MIVVYCNTCEKPLKEVEPYINEKRPGGSTFVPIHISAEPIRKGLLKIKDWTFLISGGEGHICRACLKEML